MPAMAVDVMVLAPHPDDAEMSCAGTVLRLVGEGKRVAIVDMTRGEMGSRGTPEIRERECAAATTRLGVTERINLELPDAHLTDSDAELAAVVGAIRKLRPRLLLAPMDRDTHPDHAATGAVAGRAFFVAGLVRWHPELGAPHRPSLVLRYPLHHEVEPAVCVDIAAVADAKLDVLRCYATQIPPEGERAHLVGLDVLERARARDLFYGARAGCRAAEPFAADGPLRLDDLRQLL